MKYKTLDENITYIEEDSYYMLHTHKYGNIPVKLWKYKQNYVYCFQFYYTPNGGEFLEDEILFFHLTKFLNGRDGHILYRIINLQEKIQLI